MILVMPLSLIALLAAAEMKNIIFVAAHQLFREYSKLTGGTFELCGAVVDVVDNKFVCILVIVVVVVVVKVVVDETDCCCCFDALSNVVDKVDEASCLLAATFEDDLTVPVLVVVAAAIVETNAYA